MAKASTKRAVKRAANRGSSKANDDPRATVEKLVEKTRTLTARFQATHRIGMKAFKEHDRETASAAIQKETELITEQTRLAAQFVRTIKAAQKKR